jgi:hypothetical protein
MRCCGAAAAVEQRLLDLREAAFQQADHWIVLVVGLCVGRAATVEALQQPDDSLRDRGEDVPALLRGLLIVGVRHRLWEKLYARET